MDLDGSLTGNINNTVVASDNITAHNANCRQDTSYDGGVSCSNITSWIRFAFNNLQPSLAVLANITNSVNQTVSVARMSKRLTHPYGFMAALDANDTYTMLFDQALYPINVSYSGTYYGLKPGQYIIMQHVMKKKPDRVDYGTYAIASSESFGALTPANPSGSWHWENATNTLSYIISNSATIPFLDVTVALNIYLCYYVNCITPVPPALRLPLTARPANALYWSNISTWEIIALNGGYSYIINGTIQFPRDNDSVLIPDGLYVIVDTVLPTFRLLQLNGTLELDNGRDHYLQADIVYINGGQLIIGWENNPILTNVTISIMGRKEDELTNPISVMRSKSIGVFGGI